MCSCSCCHCCSFDSLSCRLRTLKVFGAFLFLFGLIFALAGIAIGFLSDLYFHLVSLPDVFPEYILYAWLVITTGVVAVGTGMTAIYVAKTMSDDDCSTRGLAILALLTIVCSLASVGVPAWPLYEDGYFIEVPPQNPGNATTAAPTTLPITTIGMMQSTTGISTNGTGTNVTMGSNTTTTNMTMTMGTNTTMMPMNTTMDMNMMTLNMSSDENSTVCITTERIPIDFDEWVVIMAPFGIICLFAFLFVIMGLFICCIACCCPERSEIVDDIDLYKH